jgi:hypothetical protein
MPSKIRWRMREAPPQRRAFATPSGMLCKRSTLRAWSHRLPAHWRNFESRVSVLSGSSRLAANPVNAILNYLYALLEAECRLAVAALGLDPGMGVLHMDTLNRDTLACDLMEPVRPDVDAYVLNRILRQPLRRNWFFEERNGSCRLMADLATQLAETVSTWARLAAPLAEWAVKEIASTTRNGRPAPATRLTQNHKRALTGGEFNPRPKNSVQLDNLCGACGNAIPNRSKKCRVCLAKTLPQRLRTLAAEGRVSAHSEKAEAKRSRTQLANRENIRKWSSSEQPSWLTARFYAEKIQPRLIDLSVAAIARELAVSRGYATEVRRGRVPHPRHWQALVQLLGVSGQEETNGTSN